MTVKPNFIIAGEAKAGTTSLFEYLGQHAEVFMCEPKEPRYFAFREKKPSFSGPMDEEWVNQTTVYQRNDYYSLFKGAEGKTAIGEASPIYVHVPGCASAIAEEIPQVKIIIILRNPVEIALSAYRQMVRNGHELFSFEDGLAAESQRIDLNWAWHWRYVQLGLVSDNINDFLEHFPREQILFIDYRDFQRDNKIVLRDVCRFLGISESFKFNTTEVNISQQPRLVFLRNLMMNRSHWLKNIVRKLLPLTFRRELFCRINKFNMKRVRGGGAQTTRDKLTSIYSEDILKCKKLTGINLNE